MPKVPDSAPQISMNVPGVGGPSPREFGRLGNSIAGVGQEIENTGGELYAQAKRAEAINASNNAYMQDKLELDNQITQLKLQSPDGYVHEDSNNSKSPKIKNDDGSWRTVTQQAHTIADARYQNSQNSMPNDIAAQMYRERMIPHLSDTLGMVQADVQLMKVKSFDDNRKVQVQQVGDELVQSPGGLIQNPNGSYSTDLTRAYGHLDDLQRNNFDQIGIMHDAVSAQMKTIEDQKAVSKDVIQGAIPQIMQAKKEGDPARVPMIYAWLDAIHGNDPRSQERQKIGLPTISTMMDPEQKSVEEKKLLALLPTAKKADISDWTHHYDSAIAAEKSGRGDSATRQSIYADIKGFLTDGSMQRYTGVEKATGLLAANEIGKVQGPAFSAMSEEHQLQMLSDASSRARSSGQELAKRLGVQFSADEGAVAAHTIESAMKEVIDKERQAKKEDFASFAMGASPNGDPVLPSAHAMAVKIDSTRPISFGTAENKAIIRQGLRDMKSHFETSGEGHPEWWRPIPLEWSKNISDTLNDGTKMNAHQAAQGLRSMHAAFGSDYPAVIQQMIKDNNLPPQWTIAQYNPTVSGSDHLVSAIRNEADIMKNFDNTVKGSNGVIKDTDLDVAVSNYTTAFINDRIASDPYNKNTQNFGLYINQAVKANAAQLFQIRNGSTVSQLGDAARDSYNELLGNFIHVGDPNKGWFHGGLDQAPVLPKNLASDVDNAVIKNNLKGLLNEDRLKSLGAIEPPLGSGKPGPFGDKYLTSVLNGNPRWVFNQSGPTPGFNLRYRRGADGMDTLVQGGSTKKPVPLFVPLDQMKKPPMVEPGILDKMKEMLPDSGTIQKFLPGKPEPKL